MADQGGGGGILGILMIVGGLGLFAYADVQYGFLPIPGFIAAKPNAPGATVNNAPTGVSSSAQTNYNNYINQAYALSAQWAGKAAPASVHAQAQADYQDAANAIGGKLIYTPSSGVTQILDQQGIVVFQN